MGKLGLPTNKVNNPKHAPSSRPHGNITALSVTFDRMKLSGCNQSIIDLPRRSELGTGGEGRESKDEDNHNNHNCMQIVGDEGRLNTAKNGVENNANGKQEAGCHGMHPGHGVYDSRASSEQHGRDQDVCHQAKDNKDTMDYGPVARADDFQEGVGVWSPSLQFDGEGCEEDNLDTCTWFVPTRASSIVLSLFSMRCTHKAIQTGSIKERSGYAILVADRGRLKKSCCPGPTTDNCRGD